MDPYENQNCSGGHYTRSGTARTDGTTGVTFSSSKCPPVPHGATTTTTTTSIQNTTTTNETPPTCELPFGFCYTPLIQQQPRNPPFSSLSELTSRSPPDNLLQQQQQQQQQLPSGVICTTCMSYLNLYCETTATTALLESEEDDTPANSYVVPIMRWKCALCQSENIVKVDGNNDLEISLPLPSTKATTTDSTAQQQQQQQQQQQLNTILSQPVVEYYQPLVVPSSTTAATTSTTSTTTIDAITKTIIFVVDENLSATEVHAIEDMIRNIILPSQDHRNVTYQLGLITFGESISIYQLGIDAGIVVTDIIRSHEGFLLWMDTDTASNHRSYTGTSIDTIISCLSAQFSNDNEYNNNNNNGNNLTNDNVPPKKTRLQILKERKQIRLQSQEVTSTSHVTKSHLGSGGTSSNNNNEILKSPWILARERMIQSKPPYRNTADAILCAIDLASFNNNTTAVVSSFSSSECYDRRILLFTNGCPNIGDGSVVDTENYTTDGVAAFSTVDSTQIMRACTYYTLIGKSAIDISGVGIDVLCTGSSELGFPAYLSLVEASSGYVISHDTFASPRFHSNMEYILQQTHMSQQLHSMVMTESVKQFDMVADSSETLYEYPIHGCTVDIRMSSFLTSTHLIGPGELMECPSEPLMNEQMAYEGGKELAEIYQLPAYHDCPSIDEVEATLTRIRIGRYDPMSTFSVMLRVNESYQGEEYAFFQFVVRFVDVTRQYLVTRVTSHRLSVANDVGEFLEAIDEEVVPVLLAKEAVYRSMFGRDADVDQPFHAVYVDELDSFAQDAQQDLDNTVFRISGAYRLLSLVHGTKSIDLTEEGGIKATGTSMDFAFPPELSDALRRLYHLRRGPLLSPGPVQSADDRVELRSLFVRFPLEDCLSMMAPSLWSSGSLLEALDSNDLLLEAVPPETLALWENRIIAADHWNSTFLWSGSETLDPRYDIIRERLMHFLHSRSKYRFPQPNFYKLTESDSMSRRFTSLLAPSHGDPVEHQLAHFHALSYLSQEELSKLHFRFRFYDPESDPSFRKWFWEVASAASMIGSVGVSLCD